MKQIFTFARKSIMLCAATFSAQCGIAQIAFTVPPTNPIPSVTAMEYFIDADPGFGAGTPLAVLAPAQTITGSSGINTASLSEGIHRVYVRARDAYGRWGQPCYRTLVVRPAGAYFPAAAAPRNLTALEYFFDTDPGYGQGTIIMVPPAQLLQNEPITADIAGLTSSQMHTLFVRVIGGGTSATVLRMFGKGLVSLPLSLLSFEGRKRDGAVQLSWEVAAGKGLRLYEVGRSTDGAAFDLIGCVQAAAPEGTKRQYAFNDRQPPTGTCCYRLRMAYDNGEVVYSPVVRIRMDAAAEIIINNPVAGSLQLFGVPDGAQTEVQIIDLQGRVVYRDAGSRSIDVSALPAGQYLLECELDGERFVRNFQKL